MSAPDVDLENPEAPPERPHEEKARKSRLKRALIVLGSVVGVLAVLIVLVLAGLRYGVLTDPGRDLLLRTANGLELGRFGTLQLEGFEGDIWRDFTVERVTITDSQGVWLEGRRVHVEWNAAALFRRRFDASNIEAAIVRVFRRPVLAPDDGGPSQPLPVSVDIDRLAVTVETFPALSVRRGVWDVAGELHASRDNAWRGQLAALSFLHPGDGIRAGFQVGGDEPFGFTADGREAAGGALAGLLGLPADEPFSLRARGGGTAEQGSIEVVARTGDDVPAFAQGAWTPEGGRVTGRLTLAASTWTQDWAQRVGPEANFELRMGRDGDGTRPATLNVQGAALQLSASGPVNLSERSTPGLQAQLALQDLNAWVPAPEMGGAQAAGVLSGSLEDVRFEGNVTVRQVALAGYALQTISGPITLTRSDENGLTASGRVQGAGGTGTGLPAAWLGARPSAAFDIHLLNDGRLLVRSASATGAGLRLNARGERGLLGGLSFRGDLALSNLAAAAPGASGTLTADWSASQGGANRPWNFSVDASGRGLRTGLAQLDRLLGGSPRLRARGEWLGTQRIRLADASLDAEAFDATARGTAEIGGPVDMALTWSADGPFAAGPLEVSGRMTGDGRVTGTFDNPRADLNARLAAVDLPQVTLQPVNLTVSVERRGEGFTGVLGVRGDSQYGPASLDTDFAFAGDGFNLTNLRLDGAGLRAQGDVALRNGEPSLADLTVAAGPGAFLEAGTAEGRLRLSAAPGGPDVDLSLRGQGLVWRGADVPVRSLSLTARGPLSRLPFEVEVAGDSPVAYAFRGRGLYAQAGEVRTVNLEGQGTAREIAFRTLAPVVLRLAGPERSVQARIGVGGGEATVQGRQTAEAVSLRANLSGVQLGVFSEELAGRIGGDVVLEGRGPSLNGTADLTLANARNRDAPDALSLDGRVRAVLAGNRLNVEAQAGDGSTLQATANASLPVEASAAPLRLAIVRTAPISGRFDARGELQPLWDVFFGGERSLRGRLVTQGTVGGTLNDPQVTGTANVTNGRFQDAGIGLTLQDVTLAAELNGDNFYVRQFSGRDGGGGTVTGQGQVSLERNGGGNFRLALNGFQIFDTDQGSASASGTATLTRGADGALALRGRLTVDRADIEPNPPTPSGVVQMDVIERNVPAEFGARNTRPPAPRGPGVALDVQITAPRRIFVRGRGLDIEMSLNARVGGTTNAPQLSGTARVVRGDFSFAGKTFEFDERSTISLDEQPRNIRLNLTAVREDPSLTAVIRVRGTAERPEIELSSTPRLPQDEVLSQVLFGRSASQLSALEAAQLASSLSALSGGGGFDVIGGLRDFAGLDRLTFAGGGNGSALSVAGGRYITEDVYLEIIGGGREGPAAQVEWRVRRNLSVISRFGGETGARLSVRWRREW